MRQIRFAALAASLLALVTANGVTAAAPAYKATLLNPEGFAYSDGFGISDGSQVGVAVETLPDGPARAMLWSGTAESAVDLTPDGFTGAVAYAVSGNRQIGWGTEPVHALLWSGSAESVVDLNPPGFGSFGFGISGNHQVGMGNGPTTGGNNHALYWQGTAESFVDLNPTGFQHTVAIGVSETHQVGHGLGPATGGEAHALLWNGTAESFVDLNPAGYGSTQGRAISGDRQVGSGAGPATGNISQALLWRGTAESVVNLNPPGFIGSGAEGVWGAYQVGYGSGPATDHQAHALLWNDTAESYADLHPYLGDLQLPIIGSQALSIAANGQIVGTAFTETTRYAVLWTPIPEPSASVLIACGVIAAAFPRRRRLVEKGAITQRTCSMACGVALAVCLSPCQSYAATAQSIRYRVTDLGPVANSSSPEALAINDRGHVVGYAVNVPFLWTPEDGMQPLGIPDGYDGASAVGINDNGQIAVRAHKLVCCNSFAYSALRWEAGVYQDAGSLGGTITYPTGIDATGRISGFAHTPVGDIHAFRSDTETTLVDIDSLGGNYSLGYGINASGQVVGQAYTAARQYHAFLWNGSGSMIDLGVLGGDASQSEARAISDSGLIVGTSTTPSNSVHAFIWQDGVMTDLGSLTAYTSWGYGVNNAAQVIGQYSDGVFGHPYFWDATNGMRDLNSLLEPASGAGWTLYTVNDINNVGQIVGQGRHNGEVRAFLLTPTPEPSAATLFAGGLIGLSAFRRRWFGKAALGETS